jgi:hypothetical protein
VAGAAGYSGVGLAPTVGDMTCFFFKKAMRDVRRDVLRLVCFFEKKCPCIEHDARAFFRKTKNGDAKFWWMMSI